MCMSIYIYIYTHTHWFRMMFTVKRDYVLKQVFNKYIFVMEKCGVFFEVRTEFLNII
jgi:Ni/Fe-hydrogenase subunit HybB-like protein